MAEVERGGRRQTARETEFRKTKNRKAPTVTKSRSFSSRGVTTEKKKRDKSRVGSDGGPNPRFVCCRESSRRGVRVRNRVVRARARVPSTVATSSTAHDTRVVSTTRAHTSSPVEAHRKRSGGFFVRGEGTFETRVWDSVCVFSCSGDEQKKAVCGRRACGLRTSPDGSVGGAEPAFAQALVPFDDDVVRLKERQVRALLVDLRDRLGELGVVLRRWDAKRAMGTRRGRSVDAGRDAARRGTRRARRGRGFAMTDAIEPDTRRRRVSGRDTTRRRLGRACRTCRRDVSEETMARRRARAHHGRGSRQTSRRVRSTVDAQTPRVGRCVRSRFAFAEETTSLRVRRRRCARARVPRAIRRLRGRASRAIGPPRVEAFSRG